MWDFFQKLHAIEAAVARERGGILFFGLLKGADLPDQWDLVIVAPWAQEYTLDDLRSVAEKLPRQLTTEELLLVARIVLLDPDAAQPLAAAGVFRLPPGSVQAVYLSIRERLITQVYVITADPDGLPRATANGVDSAVSGPATAPPR